VRNGIYGHKFCTWYPGVIVLSAGIFKLDSTISPDVRKTAFFPLLEFSPLKQIFPPSDTTRSGDAREGLTKGKQEVNFTAASNCFTEQAAMCASAGPFAMIRIMFWYTKADAGAGGVCPYRINGVTFGFL
jgi:hypothetical protein